MKTMNTGLSSVLLFTMITIPLAWLPACGADPTPSAVAGMGGKASSGAAGKAADGRSSAGAAGAITDGGASGEAGAGGAEAKPAPQGDAVYALTTQIIAEQSQSYVLLTNTLDGDTRLKIEDGVVEIAGRALGTGPEGSGTLFVANDSSAEVSRYELTDSGALKATGSVSFLGKGVTSFGEYGGQMQYVSPEKAYWFDGPTAQVVIWNPTTMEISGEIALSGLAGAKLTMSFSAAPIWRGDKLYTFVAWRQGVSVVPRAAVVVIDSTTDTATIAEDTRCGYVRDGVLANDGQIYVATEAFGAAAQFLDIRNPKPCLLRFNPASDTFDAEFEVELSSLFQGQSAGTLVVGPNNQAFIRFLNEASASQEALAGPRQLASSSSWGWAKLSLGDQPEVEAIPSASFSGGSVVMFNLGERAFGPRFVDATYTEFVELTENGPSKEAAITIPGLVFSAVKLR